MATVIRIAEPAAEREAPQPAAPRRWTRRRVLVGMAALYLASGIYLVPPDRQAVVTRFGQAQALPVPPGIHYHWPYPIERVYRLKVRETRRAVVGGEAADAALGRTQPFQSQFLTGD